ncbi:tetratricopeptide repeat protein 1-like [Actinia tenebrosa]|uniref:Tetratricopeptide repeat protein 1-like n=1 Tax=Actinia tenebrosa TaxID=6105 RepID=A0A6P8I3Z2_ACTTE|nr:tetratricopeptide repeat protein 1-like [Actinia tenebrosa]
MASEEGGKTEIKCPNPEILSQELKEKRKETELEEAKNKDSSKEDEKSANEVNNSSDEESDSFVDAVDDMNLNEKTNDKIGKEGTVENNSEQENIDEYLEPEQPLSEEQKEERKKKAQEYKTKGNEYFKKSEYPEARELYTTAIRTCPPEFKSDKAIFYSNRAACLVKMELYKDAIQDSTKALELNPEYLKARLRRAQCYEHEDQLEEALEDYQKVFEIDKSCIPAREALRRLPDQIKIKHEKLKEEMLGKLKDLGNVFLKPFGLSTENFQMQQDPNTGGYSVNFQR